MSATTTQEFTASAELILPGDGLDQIRVYWVNEEAGRGYVTITCYGQAWTAYFGAMAGRTIQQFFDDADADYLATKLGITPLLKSRKRDLVYLGKIIRAIKSTRTASRIYGANAEYATPKDTMSAAAPDLYAALESILQYCAPLSEQQYQSRLSAFAALAKARGESL